MPPAEILSYINSGGVIGLIVGFGWAFYTRRIRLGKDVDELRAIDRERFEDMKQQRDVNKTLAYNAIDAFNRTLDLQEAEHEARDQVEAGTRERREGRTRRRQHIEKST